MGWLLYQANQLVLLYLSPGPVQIAFATVATLEPRQQAAGLSPR